MPVSSELIVDSREEPSAALRPEPRPLNFDSRPPLPMLPSRPTPEGPDWATMGGAEVAEAEVEGTVEGGVPVVTERRAEAMTLAVEARGVATVAAAVVAEALAVGTTSLICGTAKRGKAGRNGCRLDSVGGSSGWRRPRFS